MDPEVAEALREILPREIVDIIRKDFLEVCKRPEAIMIKRSVKSYHSSRMFGGINVKYKDQWRTVLYEICRVCGDIPYMATYNFINDVMTYYHSPRNPSHSSGRSCSLFFAKNEKDEPGKWIRKLLKFLPRYCLEK